MANLDLYYSFKDEESKIPENDKCPDIVDFLTIFQILGFTITHAEVLSPCSNGKGVEINVSCNHSSARFTMERINDCNCPQNMLDSVKQIMLIKKAEERRESYEKISLSIPDGDKIVIQKVLKHLLELVYKAAKKGDKNENVVDIATKDNEQNENILEASTNVRCKSLENLADKMRLENDLPEPGRLIKKEILEGETIIPAISCSSPNLALISKSSSAVDILEQGCAELLSIQESVENVIKMVRKSQELSNISLKASTESLVDKPIVGSSYSEPELVKKNNRPTCRPPIRSVSALSPYRVKSSPTTSTKLNNPEKATENISATIKTTNKKYAHVKSTIPKANTVKK